ncbi:MBL fold metallo-hydrolase [Candidatus Bipolaricaulota bacterium]|nr:MBL fold metallo-hydrolase [Candidatus Bipolaricaulota bacterium]
MRITVLYDNRAQAPAKEGWGFSALIEVQERKILFDTGADRLVLEHNVRHLEVELSKLTDVFLSHPHCDHIGGLSYVLEEAKGVHIWAPYVRDGGLPPSPGQAGQGGAYLGQGAAAPRGGALVHRHHGPGNEGTRLDSGHPTGAGPHHRLRPPRDPPYGCSGHCRD